MDARAMRAGLELARKAGAKAAEQHLELSTTFRVESLRGKVATSPPTESATLIVRVWLEGGRTGVAEGPADQHAALLDAALARAAAAPPDPHGAPVVRQTGIQGGLGILDRRLEQITAEDRAEIVSTAEHDLRQVDRRLVSGGFGYEERRLTRRYASTRGTLLEESGSSFAVRGRASVTVDGAPLELAHHQASRSFSTVASVPHGIDLGRRLVALLGDTRPLDGAVRVVLPPLAVGHLFAWVARLLTWELRREGAASFLAPRDGRLPTFDGRIHLQDDGTLPGALRTRSFDVRGVAPTPLVLLREGVPDQVPLDPERATGLGTRPTGHETSDGPRPTNLLLRSGTRSVNAVLADLGGRVLVLDDLDPRPTDVATGLLRTTVHGVLQDGTRTLGPVRHLRVRADLAEVLRRVVEVCGDTDRVAHVDAPAMIVDGFVAE